MGDALAGAVARLAAAGVAEPRARRRGAARARARHDARRRRRCGSPAARRPRRRRASATLLARRAAREPRRVRHGRARVLVAAASPSTAACSSRARRPSWSSRRALARGARGARRVLDVGTGSGAIAVALAARAAGGAGRAPATVDGGRARRRTGEPRRATRRGVRARARRLARAVPARRVRPRRREPAVRAPRASWRRSRPRSATTSRARRSRRAGRARVLRALVAERAARARGPAAGSCWRSARGRRRPSRRARRAGWSLRAIAEIVRDRRRHRAGAGGRAGGRGRMDDDRDPGRAPSSRGEVLVSGSKNAALPLLFATLLTRERCDHLATCRRSPTSAPRSPCSATWARASSASPDGRDVDRRGAPTSAAPRRRTIS